MARKHTDFWQRTTHRYCQILSTQGTLTARTWSAALLGAVLLTGINPVVSAQEDAASLLQAEMMSDPLRAAQEGFDHPVKYAIYSPAWHLSTNAGLRIVAHNQSDEPIELRKVTFRDEAGEAPDTDLELRMLIPPQGWAEKELPFQDLLAGNACVLRTMKDDWKLVEISNYTLNPSVRGLIIENTRSFRIYQCVRSVRAQWFNQATQVEQEGPQWLMYHFERLPLE